MWDLITFTIQIDREADCALVLVADNGPGIPPGRIDAVFNRFYSERPSSEAFGEHSGLGLSIARQIMRGHQGDLIARNVLNRSEYAVDQDVITLEKIRDVVDEKSRLSNA